MPDLTPTDDAGASKVPVPTRWHTEEPDQVDMSLLADGPDRCEIHADPATEGVDTLVAAALGESDG